MRRKTRRQFNLLTQAACVSAALAWTSCPTAAQVSAQPGPSQAATVQDVLAQIRLEGLDVTAEVGVLTTLQRTRLSELLTQAHAMTTESGAGTKDDNGNSAMDKVGIAYLAMTARDNPRIDDHEADQERQATYAALAEQLRVQAAGPSAQHEWLSGAATLAAIRAGDAEAAVTEFTAQARVESADLEFGLRRAAILMEADPVETADADIRRLASQALSGSDARVCMLAEDVLVRTSARQARRTGLPEAWNEEAYVRFLGTDTLTMKSREREDLALEKLAALAQAYPLEGPLAELVYIWSRDEAASLERLETSLKEGEGLPMVWKLRAGWELAQAHARLGAHTESAQAYLEVARRFGTDERAPQAALRAVNEARAARTGDPHDAESGELLLTALSTAVDRFPTLAQIDELIVELAYGLAGAGKEDEALQRLRTVPRSSSLFNAAQVALAQITLQVVENGKVERNAGMMRVVALAEAGLDAIQDREEDEAIHQRTALRIVQARAQAALGQWESVNQTLAQLPSGSEMTPAERIAADWVRLQTAAAQEQGAQAVELADRLMSAGVRETRDFMQSLAGRALDGLRRGDSASLDEGEKAQRGQKADEFALPVIRWCAANVEQTEVESLESAAAWQLGEGLYFAGKYPEAQEAFGHALTSGASGGSAQPVVFARAETLFALQRTEEAVLLFRQLAAATAAERTSIYWRSELRTLQCLEQAGRNLTEIYPRIARLRRTDAGLGGGQIARAFADLEARHKP